MTTKNTENQNPTKHAECFNETPGFKSGEYYKFEKIGGIWTSCKGDHKFIDPVFRNHFS